MTRNNKKSFNYNYTFYSTDNPPAYHFNDE